MFRIWAWHSNPTDVLSVSSWINSVGRQIQRMVQLATILMLHEVDNKMHYEQMACNSINPTLHVYVDSTQTNTSRHNSITCYTKHTNQLQLTLPTAEIQHCDLFTQQLFALDKSSDKLCHIAPWSKTEPKIGQVWNNLRN